MTRVERRALVVTIALLLASPANAWVQRFEDSGDLHHESEDVAADSSGDVLVAGWRRPASAPELRFVVSKLDGSTGGEVWRAELIGPGSDPNQAFAVAVDDSDDVLAGGWISSATTSEDFAVVKLDGGTGAELWRYTLDGTAGGSPHDQVVEVVADGSGDVLAVGNVYDVGGGGFNVVKLDGATGAELWRVKYLDAGGAVGVAVDSVGEVYAVGVKHEPGIDDPLLLVKLDAASGAELWRQEIDPGTDGRGLDVAVDSNDDVVVSGSLGGLLRQFAVLKFDGASGTELWRSALFEPGSSGGTEARAVAFDAIGDVLVAGHVGSENDTVLVAKKLDGASGAELWRTDIDGTEVSFGREQALDLAVSADGDAFVVGTIHNATSNEDGIVVRLDGSTGAEIWRLEHDGTAPVTDFLSSRDSIRAIALLPSGDPVVVGELKDDDRAHDFLALRLDRDDGSAFGFPGRKLFVKDPGDPSKRLATFLIKDEMLQAPSPGSIHDPRTAGATLRLWNPSTLEEATFFLPAGPEWTGIGTPSGVKGYRYADKSGMGPCTKVTLRPKKKLGVTCKAKTGSIPFTLDEPSQGSLAVSLQMGGAAPQCATFGGFLLRDEPGLFKAKAAPGTPACP